MKFSGPSQIVVGSQEMHRKLITYVGKLAHHKSADSSETAEKNQEGELRKYRTMWRKSVDPP